MKKKINGWADEKHPLAGMENARVALRVLTREDHTREAEITLCICCRKFGRSKCPYRGDEPKGICDHYRLDKRNPTMVQKRVIVFLEERR